MYENYRLCETLTASEICFVVQQYNEGKFTGKFHAHVPKSRLSDDARRNVLRALVIHFSGMSAELIVNCHLNSRGRRPPADNRLNIVVSRPEAGVLRWYCGGDTQAWSTSPAIGVGCQLTISVSGQLLSGLLGITFTAEAGGVVTVTSPQSVQANFDVSIDITVCWFLDVSFDESFQYTQSL
jgi:hypothetical protein